MGVVTSVAAWGLGALEISGRIPLLGKLLAKPGAVGGIARIVLWFTLWVVLLLVVHLWRTRRELRVVRLVEQAVQRLNHHSIVGDLDNYLRLELRRQGASHLADQVYDRSLLSSRLSLLTSRLADHNRSDRVSFLLVGQSGIEAAQTDSFYGLPRALIWAMPGLGFMGTAFEMANAVGGMGSSLRATGDYQALQNLLSREVIPHLAGAFDVTLFALGASVVCFLLLSLVHQQDEKVLNASDALSLALLAKIADDDPKDGLASSRQMELAEKVENLRAGLTIVGAELSKLNEFIGKSSNALQAVFRT
jgi:hypothetical protein